MNALLEKALPYIGGLLLVLLTLFGAYHHGVTVTDSRWQAKWSARDAADAVATLKADEDARVLEQTHQHDIDKVRTDAANQKTVDDALAAKQRADNDSLRDQTSKLLADRAALSARLAARGKTIGDLADLLAQLRTEADGYAGELASALTASRRAASTCQRSYDAIAESQAALRAAHAK